MLSIFVPNKILNDCIYLQTKKKSELYLHRQVIKVTRLLDKLYICLFYFNVISSPISVIYNLDKLVI